jgi:hypothetical protein
MSTNTNAPKKLADVSTDIMGSKLTVSFANGYFVEVDVTTLTREMQLQSMLHGMKQKLVDAAAIPRDTVTGRSATLADKIAAVEEVAQRVLVEGLWNKVRGDGTGSNKGSKSYICEAIMEVYGKERAKVTEWLKGKTKEEVAALKVDPKIAPVIAKLEAAKVANVDTSEMLDELDNI